MSDTEQTQAPKRRTRRRRKTAKLNSDSDTKGSETPTESVSAPGETKTDRKTSNGESSESDKNSSEEGRRSRGRRRRGRSKRADSDASNGPSETGTSQERSSAENRNERGPASSSKNEESEKNSKAPASRRRTRRRSGSSAPSTSAGGSASSASKTSDEPRKMLINVTEEEECRIAVVHKGRLEELFMERSSAESHVGNIYKGRITNVEPSIQAAFIDFGLAKNGFLHISDLQPQYFPDGSGKAEDVGRKTPRRDRPPIQKCLRRGQEIIVQIIKEGIGTKGPTMTTYISIPGRYLVMMPGMNRLGVSRKIEDEDVRRKMRKILEELDLPRDMGFILRTAGVDQTKRELQRDHQYLMRLWKVVAKRIRNERAPCELYQESDLVIRTIRDVYTSDFDKIIVDDPETGEKVQDFLSLAMPRSTMPVEVYTGNEPLFFKYGVEREIERIYDRHVPLPSGGSLVIDSTEACVTIDVNSSRFREIDDAEESAFKINLEAAEEIARQLRLRDLGGLIICDFIDMRMDKHRREMEKALREALKKHKERAKCLRTSQFGIIEITRQRMRPSIKRSIYHDCPQCRGSGLVKNTESISLDLMRVLRLAVYHDQVAKVEIRVPTGVAGILLNEKRGAIHALEEKSERQIVILPEPRIPEGRYHMECFDHRGSTVQVLPEPEEEKSPAHHRQRSAPHDSRNRPPEREAPESLYD